MRLAILLFELVVLLGLVLAASLFITLAATGGSAFDEWWPYLAPPICVLALLSIVSTFLSRKSPEVRVFRSIWPLAILAVLLVSGGALFFYGVVG